MHLDKKARLEMKFQECWNSVLKSKTKEEAKRIAIEKEAEFKAEKEREKQVMRDFKCVITSYNTKRANPEKNSKYTYIFSNSSKFLMNKDSYISIIKRLKFIDLSSMNLEDYPFHALNHMINLERLNLSNNPGLGSKCDSKSFKQCKEISMSTLCEEIDKIKIADKKPVFCRNIKILSLNGNRLLKLPGFVEHCQNLETLYLNDNRIETLQNGVEKLKSLIYLDLYNNRLSAISKTIGDLARLEYLDLSGNRILDLPSEIGNLKNLRHLNLTSNCLSDLPSTIGNLANLVDLRLSFNSLTSLPEEIRNLGKLEILHIDYNQIVKIPDGVASLKLLKILDFSNNKILNFPKCILELNSIEEIVGKNNHLASIPAGLNALQKLRKLDLSTNKIPFLPRDFNSLSLRLDNLDLRTNPIVDASVEGNIGRYELAQIFMDRVFLDPVALLRESEEISKDKVYQDLQSDKLCWVFEKIRKIKNREILEVSENADELILLIEESIKKSKAEVCLSNENFISIKNFIHHVYSPDDNYSKYRISNNHADLVKYMLGSVIKTIAGKCDNDKRLLALSVILEALNYCEDRLVADIRSLYYYLHDAADPDQSLEAYVCQKIAIEKEMVLFYSASHREATQSAHLYNYWMYELRDEIGFNFQFDSAFGTQGQDKFNGWHGNAVRGFYKLFNPTYVVYKLMESINSTPRILCLALEWLHLNLQENHNDSKSMYIKGVEDDIGFAVGITQEFVLFFMVKMGLISENP